MKKEKEVYWDKLAQTYNEDQTYIVGTATQQEIINKLSGEHDLGELIEFGCGAGYFTKAIAKNSIHVIATDISDMMLEMARTQIKDFQKVTIEKADCEKTTFQSSRFDSIFMANLIHVVENPIKTLKEAHRILKDDGLLLIVDYTMYGMRGFEKMKAGIRFLRKWGKPPRYFRGNLSPDEFKSLVESVGFKVEKVQIIGDKIKAMYLKGKKQ
jgi:ABC-2 type transport system ATP-binding protein